MKRQKLDVVKIFIGSPGGHDKERNLFREAVVEMNEIKAKQLAIHLESKGCEDTLLGRRRPQKDINKDLKDCDLVVLLLGERWGSSTGSIKYSSGFEEEFEVACQHRKEILLYFREIPEQMLTDPGEQLQKVLAFRDKIETEKPCGFREYQDPEEWVKRFRINLSSWLDKVVESNLIHTRKYPKSLVSGIKIE